MPHYIFLWTLSLEVNFRVSGGESVFKDSLLQAVSRKLSDWLLGQLSDPSGKASWCQNWASHGPSHNSHFLLLRLLTSKKKKKTLPFIEFFLCTSHDVDLSTVTFPLLRCIALHHFEKDRWILIQKGRIKSSNPLTTIVCNTIGRRKQGFSIVLPYLRSSFAFQSIPPIYTFIFTNTSTHIPSNQVNLQYHLHFQHDVALI